MTAHTHSLAEWLAFLCLGISGWAAGSALLYLICDADPSDFDPRPAVRRLAESGRVDWLLTLVANVRFDVRELAVDAWQFCRLTLRDAALSLAALLALFSTTPEALR